MPKRKPAATQRPGERDKLTAAIATEKRQLRQLVRGKRDVAQLVSQLRRRIRRTDDQLIALVESIARAHGREIRVPDGKPGRTPATPAR